MANWKDEITTLEHATLKVPYELLNKKFRAVQKVVDREASHVSTSISDLTSCIKTQPTGTRDSLLCSLDAVEQRLNTLKRKAEDGLDDELNCVRLCKTRIDHLISYSRSEYTEGIVIVWRKTRLNRLLVDHFLREGYYASAIALAKSADINNLVDVNVFEVCQRVEDGLRSQNTGPCLSWCHDNRSKLRRLKSSLEYRVRLQDFIEMIRQEKRMDAVRYAKKHLSCANEELMSDLKSAMALLAFNPDTTCTKYKHLYALKRWEELIVQFRMENLALYQLTSQSILTATLQCGLSSLKTRQCYKSDKLNLQCPVCCSLFNQLASSLPYSHSSQSYLICTISGEPMNEYNPPMLLPNGQVYGEQALLSMSLRNNGKVTCIHSSEMFDFNEVKKVYVM